MMILTRGMGERLTYGIPARYRVVLMERLGGLFFDGGRSCVGDSFRWSFGSVSLRVSRGEYTFFFFFFFFNNYLGGTPQALFFVRVCKLNSTPSGLKTL